MLKHGDFTANFALPATQILCELTCYSAKRRCNTSSVNQAAIPQKEEKLWQPRPWRQA
jgi:hypothetical protein